MTIFETSSCVGIVVGAVGGSVLGYSCLGWVGAALGVPVGAVAGAFVLPLMVYAVWLVGIYREAGLAGVRDEVWPGRGTGGDQGGQPPGHGPV